MEGRKACTLGESELLRGANWLLRGFMCYSDWLFHSGGLEDRVDYSSQNSLGNPPGLS
jgi:hypothetical protein